MRERSLSVVPVVTWTDATMPLVSSHHDQPNNPTQSHAYSNLAEEERNEECMNPAADISNNHNGIASRQCIRTGNFENLREEIRRQKTFSSSRLKLEDSLNATSLTTYLFPMSRTKDQCD
jgi:hypothetical protein